MFNPRWFWIGGLAASAGALAGGLAFAANHQTAASTPTSPTGPSGSVVGPTGPAGVTGPDGSTGGYDPGGYGPGGYGPGPVGPGPVGPTGAAPTFTLTAGASPATLSVRVGDTIGLQPSLSAASRAASLNTPVTITSASFRQAVLFQAAWADRVCRRSSRQCDACLLGFGRCKFDGCDSNSSANDRARSYSESDARTGHHHTPNGSWVPLLERESDRNVLGESAADDEHYALPGRSESQRESWSQDHPKLATRGCVDDAGPVVPVEHHAGTDSNVGECAWFVRAAGERPTDSDLDHRVDRGCDAGEYRRDTVYDAAARGDPRLTHACVSASSVESRLTSG